MALSKEEIAARLSNRHIEAVAVPEWGGDEVNLRIISAYDGDRFDRSLVIVKDDGKFESNTIDADVRLLVKCIADDNGDLLYNDDDVEWLAKSIPAPVAARLAAAARKINSLGDEAVEEAGKDSESDPTTSSTTS